MANTFKACAACQLVATINLYHITIAGISIGINHVAAAVPFANLPETRITFIVLP